MDSSKRYTEEFEIEAIKQVTERDYSVADANDRPDTPTYSLYAGLKRYGERSTQQANKSDEQTTIVELKAALRRITEERDMLKKATKYFASAPE